jgi:hypothetical protein
MSDCERGARARQAIVFDTVEEMIRCLEVRVFLSACMCVSVRLYVCFCPPVCVLLSACMCVSVRLYPLISPI